MRVPVEESGHVLVGLTMVVPMPQEDVGSHYLYALAAGERSRSGGGHEIWTGFPEELNGTIDEIRVEKRAVPVEAHECIEAFLPENAFESSADIVARSTPTSDTAIGAEKSDSVVVGFFSGGNHERVDLSGAADPFQKAGEGGPLREAE